MSETTVQQNIEKSRKDHLIPGKEIHMKNMHGHRFAEVALIWGTSEANAVADFYNTTGVADPRPKAFETLDAKKLAKETGSLMVFLNPPRYWMFDEFSVWEVGDDRDFNGIKHTWMGVVGAADLKKSIIQGSYVPGYIYRANSFGYDEGTEVYLLDAPDGEVFVMQSYNAHTDDGLAKEVDPAMLADRLTLPDGWTFRVKVLDRDLQVSTANADHLAHVTQDDLLNRYQGSDGGKAFNYLP